MCRQALRLVQLRADFARAVSLCPLHTKEEWARFRPGVSKHLHPGWVSLGMWLKIPHWIHRVGAWFSCSIFPPPPFVRAVRLAPLPPVLVRCSPLAAWGICRSHSLCSCSVLPRPNSACRQLGKANTNCSVLPRLQWAAKKPSMRVERMTQSSRPRKGSFPR